MREKIIAPITSSGRCILDATRPIQVNTINTTMAILKMVYSIFDLMYLGKTIIVIAKMVVTNITCVEGKDGSPELLGLTSRMKNLSKIIQVITIKTMGNGIHNKHLSTFLIDLCVIHWYSAKEAKIQGVASAKTKIISVITFHVMEQV